MALDTLVLWLILAIFGCAIIQGNELKQDQPENIFNLTCPYGHAVSVFGADFIQDGNDPRRYKIQCQKLKYSGPTTCTQGKETVLLRYFNDAGCGQNEYLSGLVSTKFSEGDRRFRLICCRTAGMAISDSTCRELTTTVRQNFAEKLSDDEVIHQLSSKFSLWQLNNRFTLDRRWTMRVCKIDIARNSTTPLPVSPTASLVDQREIEPTNSTELPPLSKTCKVGEGHSGDSVPTGPGTIETGKNTPAFKSFAVYCPNGHAISSIRVIAKVDKRNNRNDTSFNIKCKKMPLDDEITSCPVKRQELEFREDSEGRGLTSAQSPCEMSNGQFLCGLSGVYERNKRRLTGTCCTIKDVYPLSKAVQPVLADTTDAGFAEIEGTRKDQFLVNLDQLPLGSMVGHVTTFARLVPGKGRVVASGDSCKCKCPCKCQLEQEHKGDSPRQRRLAQKLDCTSVHCDCKCLYPCDK